MEQAFAQELASQIKRWATELGFELVGICDAKDPQGLPFYQTWLEKGYHAGMGYLARQVAQKRSLENLLPRARSVVAVGLNYKQTYPNLSGQPRIAQYALGRDYHKVLRKKLKKIVSRISAEHIQARFRICVDSAPVFEREYAQRAGLGWFGKNTMLINSHRGSLFLIGLILTDLELAADQPATGGCGTCKLCVEACPTQAILYENGRWQLNSGRCISYFTIEHKGEIEPKLAEQMGDWTFGCDICQEVCPFNQRREHQPLRGIETQEKDFLAHRDWPSLEQLAQISYENWDHLTQGSAVRRVGHEGLRRNAGWNLHNLSRMSVPKRS